MKEGLITFGWILLLFFGVAAWVALLMAPPFGTAVAIILALFVFAR